MSFRKAHKTVQKELLQPFKDGAFRIAADTQKPLLPIAVVGAGKLMRPGTIQMRPGKIKIVVGPEISVGAEEDTRALKEKTFATLETMLKSVQGNREGLMK
ncbi:MAG: hypothetical protein KIT62_02570 [Cyclobacteriaceae bacterium]|nr:hypothetical protein [Cyclobacteriaceae bacterium]